MILLFSLPLVKLYVSAPLAIEIARKGLFINLIFYESLACMDIGSSILRGMGKSFLSTVISLMGSCAMRILWILFVFPFFRTFEAVIISYPISWLLTSIASFTACMIVRKNLMKQEPEHMSAIS